MAQRISVADATSPVVIHTVHSVTIPPIVGIVGSTVMPASGGHAACTTSCFESIVGVRANTKWRLQVALTQPLDHAAVEWIETGTSVAHRLAPGEYLTVAAGDESTPQWAVALSFKVHDETASGASPDASQVAGLLSYRVVPQP